jgi:hypothetical protein
MSLLELIVVSLYFLVFGLVSYGVGEKLLAWYRKVFGLFGVIRGIDSLIYA